MFYPVAILIVLHKAVVLNMAAAVCQETGYERIDICRQPTEKFKFTKGALHFHTDGLDFEFSMCACQVTSDIAVGQVDFLTRYHTSETHPFDVHIISGSNVSLMSSQTPVRSQGSLPFELIIGKKNLSRDISFEDRVDYCILLHSDALKYMTMRCTTFREISHYQDNISVTIWISCLLAAAVVCLAIGFTCGYCCRSKPSVHRLTGEIPCRDFGDSGIASDGHLSGTGQEWGVESDYASVDIVDTCSEKEEIITGQGSREKHNNFIMVDNALYSKST